LIDDAIALGRKLLRRRDPAPAALDPERLSAAERGLC